MFPTEYEEIPEATLINITYVRHWEYELYFQNKQKETFVLHLYTNIMWQMLQADNFKSLFGHDISYYKQIPFTTQTYNMSLLVARYDPEGFRSIIKLGSKESIWILDNTNEIDKEYFEKKAMSDKLNHNLPDKHKIKNTKI